MKKGGNQAKLGDQNAHITAIKKFVRFIALTKFKISFTVRNNHTNELILKIPKAQSIKQRLLLLFNFEVQNDFFLTNFTNNNKFSIDLNIINDGHFTNHYQFFYINNRYINYSELYEYFNLIFKKKHTEFFKVSIYLIIILKSYSELIYFSYFQASGCHKI